MADYQLDDRLLSFLMDRYELSDLCSDDWQGFSRLLKVKPLGSLENLDPETVDRLSQMAKEQLSLEMVNLLLEQQSCSGLTLKEFPRGIKVVHSQIEIAAFKVKSRTKTKSSKENVRKAVESLLLFDLAPQIFKKLVKDFSTEGACDYLIQTHDFQLQYSGEMEQEALQDEVTTRDCLSEFPDPSAGSGPVLRFFQQEESRVLPPVQERPRRATSGERHRQPSRTAEEQHTSHRLTTRSHSHDSKTFVLDHHGEPREVEEDEGNSSRHTDPPHKQTTPSSGYDADPNIILTTEVREQIGIPDTRSYVVDWGNQQQKLSVSEVCHEEPKPLLGVLELERDIAAVIVSEDSQNKQSDSKPSFQEDSGRRDTPIPENSHCLHAQTPNKPDSDKVSQVLVEEEIEMLPEVGLLDLFEQEVIRPYVPKGRVDPKPTTEMAPTSRFLKYQSSTEYSKILSNFRTSFFDDNFSIKCDELLRKVQLKLFDSKHSKMSQDDEYWTSDLLITDLNSKLIRLIHTSSVSKSVSKHQQLKIRRFLLLSGYFPSVALQVAMASIKIMFDRPIKSKPALPGVFGDSGRHPPKPSESRGDRDEKSPKCSKISVALPNLPANNFSYTDKPAEPVKPDLVGSGKIPSAHDTLLHNESLTDHFGPLGSGQLSKESKVNRWAQRGVIQASETINNLDGSLGISCIDQRITEESMQSIYPLKIQEEWIVSGLAAQEVLNKPDFQKPKSDKAFWPTAMFNSKELESYFGNRTVNQSRLTLRSFLSSQLLLKLKTSPAILEDKPNKEQTLKCCFGDTVGETLKKFFREALKLNIHVVKKSKNSAVIYTENHQILASFDFAPTDYMKDRHLFEVASMIVLRVIYKIGIELILKRFPNYGN